MPSEICVSTHERTSAAAKIGQSASAHRQACACPQRRKQDAVSLPPKSKRPVSARPILCDARVSIRLTSPCSRSIRLRFVSTFRRTATRLSATPSSSDDPPGARMTGSMTESPRVTIDQPYARLLLRRVQGRAHSELIAARLNLKWNNQIAALIVPIEPDIRAIDGEIDFVVVPVDDRSLLGKQLALNDLRRSVRENIGANARRHRQIDIEICRY